jgi:hypothetical protein
MIVMTDGQKKEKTLTTLAHGVDVPAVQALLEMRIEQPWDHSNQDAMSQST